MYYFRVFAEALGFHPPVSARNVAASLGYTGSVSIREMMTRPLPPISLSPSGIVVPIRNVRLAWEDRGITNYNRATHYHLSLSPVGPIPDIPAPMTSYIIPYNLFFHTIYQW